MSRFTSTSSVCLLLLVSALVGVHWLELVGSNPTRNSVYYQWKTGLWCCLLYLDFTEMLGMLNGSSANVTEERVDLISHIALIKRNALAAPFLASFEEQKSLQASYKEPAGAQQMDLEPSEHKGELKIINYRDNEAIFVRASHDRVTVIFSTQFQDETDRVYGRVFLQVRRDLFRASGLPSRACHCTYDGSPGSPFCLSPSYPMTDRLGICRRTQAPVAAERTTSDLLEPGTSS